MADTDRVPPAFGGVQRFQVVGAPAWIDSERFMIEAKPLASSKLSSFTPSNREAPLLEEQRQMLANCGFQPS